MRFIAIAAALLFALPAAAQTSLTGTTAPATSAPPLAGTSADPGTAPATAPITQGVGAPAHRRSAHPRMTQAKRFEAANTTHDGKLTLAQAQAGMPRVAKTFTAIDKTNRGYVTMADIRAYNHEQRVARKAAAAKQ